jgi:hypothetical protein
MEIRTFTGSVPPETGAAMEAFEEEFSYPLGDACRFRIRHGRDYLRFFRAMGRAELAVVSNGGVISGSIVHAARTVAFHPPGGGSPESLPARYLCDLKVAPAARGSTALARLIRETRRAILASGATRCYCVVMGGTGRLPTHYTGRLGVPAFQPLGDIAILRVSGDAALSGGILTVDEPAFQAVAGSIHHGGHRPLTGNGALRSLSGTTRLISADGTACAILEDTRLGKRLITDDGRELVSAHLSGFRHRTPEAGATLIRHAVALARGMDMPAVFLAVPASAAIPLIDLLDGLTVTNASATVYGHGFTTGADWWIDTAEI